MQAILNALKATYNFFVGDAILLAGAVVAFLLGTVFLHFAFTPGSSAGNILGAAALIAFIVIGLITTLARELMGRK